MKILKKKLFPFDKNEYGACMPYSYDAFCKLKKEGESPEIIEGWIEISEGRDLLPDEEFLKLYKPTEYDHLEDINYDDYTRVISHTWVVNKGKIIDDTGPLQVKNHHYGVILGYHTKSKYLLSDKECSDFYKGKYKTWKGIVPKGKQIQ